MAAAKMKTFTILLGIYCILPILLAITPPSKSPITRQKLDPRWVAQLCATHQSLVSKKFNKRQSMDSEPGEEYESEDSASDVPSSSSMMHTLKSYLNRIPQINFYSSIPNAIGVLGQGFSVLEKVSTALGTPLPYWIGSLPVIFFSIALVFIPDLTTLNLPGFYPAGAGDNDPLAAFPPRPNLDNFPDIDLSLSTENFPPRIIPSNSSDSNSVDIPLAPAPDGPFDPTNPIAFDAPRRRIIDHRHHYHF